MNWITNFVRPKLQAIVGKKEIPEDLWKTCPNCGQMILKRDLKINQHVCTSCDYHLRISAKERLDNLLENNYSIIETPKIKIDPLKFKDKEKYSEKLKKAKKKNEAEDVIIVATGRLGNIAVVIACFDFNFMGGSMGMAAGEAIVKAADYASKNSFPLIICSSSGGARMQEGILSLMQMPRTIVAINSLKKKRIPFFSLLTDPTTGGVSASFAMLGDLIIAEKGAIIGFAGSRVIQETIKEKLPENFQKSEYLFDNGMIDIIVHRKDLKYTLIKVVKLLANK